MHKDDVSTAMDCKGGISCTWADTVLLFIYFISAVGNHRNGVRFSHIKYKLSI